MIMTKEIGERKEHARRKINKEMIRNVVIQKKRLEQLASSPLSETLENADAID
jgi:hypothetical protein